MVGGGQEVKVGDIWTGGDAKSEETLWDLIWERVVIAIHFSGGAAERKGKHHHFSILCVSYCDNRISRNLILKSDKVLYRIIST